MDGKLFYDEQHARNYLTHSIIRKGHRPIFINDIQAVQNGVKDWRVLYNFLGEQDQNIMFLPHHQVDMNPVPLGMLNHTSTGTLWYVARRPCRNWKIGLCSQNISMRQIGQQDRDNEWPEMLHKDVEMCIEGFYPDYTTVVKKMRKGQIGAAFSRNFGVTGGSLVYKTNTNPVGVAEKGEPILFDTFQYLTEVLREDLNVNHP